MKIAIIGSGAAALGVLDLLSTLARRPEITIIDRAEQSRPPSLPLTAGLQTFWLPYISA